ncbi:MogA/MoaB family molybdenum cofactor biosynthesis protein [Bacillus sp. FJAT-49736]|uniref:MogA/MoaB family molybdenum cofactor biosynthesis protein n=1 Tax=Bacillus sp. FJAT-49736 TaxID=2833582 RepID=UPI001BCA4000|nr:MogA/MoaB family molybdenum cofactor biosynthesis protein [Bacillus sp. FJAT-49736]MBS4173808.1 MogA/MoaB family molybdenum cofactor biosynthesis protein [Bacillus sp. FJAT-49736]
MSVGEHKKQAPHQVKCAVITVSDTRSEETDKSGKLMKEMLMAKGHSVEFYQIVKDEGNQIIHSIHTILENSTIKVILLNGGTGIAKRDITIETVSSLFEKEIVGFGELFRFLSYTEDIGPAAMLSRAAAGTYRNRVIFSTPGSTGAVKLAMEKLILPELTHIVRELDKDQ